ncbi:bacterial regulatory helix-turn-helix, lysR family protein, partial [Yersinia pestis PY-02]
MGARPKLC